MNIRPNHLVLEIGSGHNPHPRSDVLCDKELINDRERGGPLVADRPLVIADAEALPFREGAFDYVICSHVVEHARDIERFLKEVQRVGRAGYIETPSSIAERLYGWDYHRWLIDRIDNRLIIRPKTFSNAFGLLFHELVKRSRSFAAFHRNSSRLLLTQYEWSGRIDYRMEPADFEPYDLREAESARSMLDMPKPSWRRRFGSVVPTAARRFAKRTISRWSRSARPNVSLQELAVCPSCKGELIWSSGAAKCASEGITFKTVDGTPIFLLDETQTSENEHGH